MEKAIIEKIKKQMIEINKLSSYDNYFNLNHQVDKILGNIFKLIEISDDDEKKQTYETIWKHLDYTNGREVKFAKNAYNKARKKNARKIRESEYSSSLKKAINQIDLDLSHFKN